MEVPTLPSSVNDKTKKRHARLCALLRAAEAFELRPETESYIQDQLNTLKVPPEKFSNALLRAHARILNRLAGKEKLTPPKYHTKLWLGLGVGAFGVPIGVAYSTAMENPAMIGFGIPIGLVIGLAIGAGLDKKAKAEDRCLDIEE